MSTGYDLSGMRVLIVDDNRHMHYILRCVFLAMRVRDLSFVFGGAEALVEMRQNQPDVLVSDLAMQPVDGLELVKLLRRGTDSPNPHIPIILLTGHTEQNKVRAAIDAGCNHVLAKPISVKAFYMAITDIIERPRPFVRTKTYFGPDRRRANRPFKGVERRKDNVLDLECA